MPIQETDLLYSPARVASRDVESNGKLLPDKTLMEISTALSRGKLPIIKGGKGRISKKKLKEAGIDAKYSIIVAPQNNPKQPYRIYAVYKGEKHNLHLGKGAFGKVKIAQDQTTGEFLAIKLLKGIDKSKPGASDQQASLDAELNTLKRVGQFAESLSYPTETNQSKQRYGNETIAVLMKLAPGIPLSNLPIQRFSAAQSLQMIVALARDLDELHRNGIVHKDMKAANALFEQSSGKVTIIDYGTALQMGKNKSVTDKLAGTPIFMEPAFRRAIVDFSMFNSKYQKIKNDKETRLRQAAVMQQDIKKLEISGGDAANLSKLKSQHETITAEAAKLEALRESMVDDLKAKHRATMQASFSAATDVYNLGMLVADVLDLKVPVTPKAGEIDCNHYEVKTNPGIPNEKIKDEKLRKEIINFLLRMTDESPEKRPSMREVQTFFDRHRLLQRNAPGAEIKTGLLDIKEFSQASDVDKRSLIAALKSNDKIQLICSDSSINKVQAQAIKKELEEYYKLSVMPSVIYGESPTAKLAAGIPELRKNAPLKEKYSLVTQQALTVTQRTQLGKSIAIVEIPSTRPAQQRQPQITSMPPVPRKVALEDLGQDGKLIPSDVTAQIRKKLFSGELIPQSETGKEMTSTAGRLTEKRLKAAGINSNFSVIVKKQGNDFQIFAVYKGKDRSLGAGAFGSVKLVQDLDSGEFHALKLQSGSLQTESSVLAAAGQRLIASIVYEPESATGKTRYKAARGQTLANGIITELATGTPLNSPELQRLPVTDRVKMLTSAGQQLAVLHHRGYTHNDIKPDNILYDVRSKKPPRIIDWGTAVKIGEKDMPKGTPEFCAPEVTSGEGAAIVYTGKTDVYSYAIMVGVCLGLAKNHDKHYEIASQQDKEFEKNGIISDKAIRAELQSLLLQATNPDPDKRPDMAALVQKIAAIQHKLEAIEAKRPEIGILDLTKYELSSTRDKKIMLDGLRQFETVRLISPGTTFDPIKAQKLLREILSLDAAPGKPILRVEHSIAHGDTAEKLTAAVIADVKNKSVAYAPSVNNPVARKRAGSIPDPVRVKPVQTTPNRPRSVSKTEEKQKPVLPKMHR